MNTLQLTRQMAAHLSVEDASNLTGPVALDVLSALNAGLQAVYEVLPRRFRETSLSHTLRAPVEVPLVFDGPYDREFTGSTFTDAQIGCSVRVPGQMRVNQIVSGNRLFDEHTGSELNVTATVYSDCAPLHDIIEEIVSAVRIYGGGLSRDGQILRRDETQASRDHCAETGVPAYFDVEPVGESQDATPSAYLRVWPMPMVDYLVRMRALISPRRFGLADLVNAVDLPVPEWVADRYLVPVCVAMLTVSDAWTSSRSIGDARDKAAMALDSLRGRAQQDMAPVSRRVGTPWGF